MEIYSIITLVLISLLGLNALKNETLLVVTVARRSSDLYLYSIANSSRAYYGICNDSTGSSFLVSEKRCITNEELIGGNIMILDTIIIIIVIVYYTGNFNNTDCNFAITTREDIVPSIYRSILIISYQELNNSTVSTNAITVDSQGTDAADAVVVLKEQQVQINNNRSFCAISSLEVYRGRDQAIEISHQGFSLGDGGIIEVLAMTLS